MNVNPCSHFRPWCCAVALALLIHGAATLAADAPNIAKDDATTGPAIPKSQFEESLPTGRDPFYPAYRPVTSSGQSTNTPAPVVSSFVLNGVLRASNKKLAIINGRTFEVGENNEISTPSGKIRIHVNEILDEKVVITVGDPPQVMELQMKEKYIRR